MGELGITEIELCWTRGMGPCWDFRVRCSFGWQV